ncbi:MAG: redoxin domain-containing protein [Planctomycetota bacterium]
MNTLCKLTAGLVTLAAASTAAIAGTATASGVETTAAAESAPKVGEMAPDFTLTDVHGVEHKLSEYRGKTVVLEWFNPDCPFVKKFHKNSQVMADTFAAWGGVMNTDGDVVARGPEAEANELDVVFLAINSGAEGKQGYGLERNALATVEYRIQYPVLLDESGKVGKTYGSTRTPEIFIVDADGKIAYHGPIDNNQSGRTIGDTNYIATALTQIAAGETVVTPTIAPYGCGVKYAKSGY